MKNLKHMIQGCVFSIVGVILLGVAPLCVSAEEKKEDGGDLRAAVQNPISSLVSLPFNFNFDYGAANGDGTILNIQPVYPVTKGKWNYVSRLILPVASVDGAISTPENPNLSGLDMELYLPVSISQIVNI